MPTSVIPIRYAIIKLKKGCSMDCVICNKSLENELNVIKYEKTYLCKQCFNNLLEKADNKLDFLWKAILSNSTPMMNAFLRTLFTPVQISKEKVVLETSSKSISNHFESKRKLFIETLSLVYSDENNECDVEVIINPDRKKYDNQGNDNKVEDEEVIEVNVENIISHFLDTVTFNDIWGDTVKINKFRRRDFVFIEGYYSSLKILLKIAKGDIPNIDKYLNDVDDRKDILINPIMLLSHFFIELSLKRYISKLEGEYENIHNKKCLFDNLEKLWNDRTSDLTEEFWLENSFLQGYSITNRLKTVKEIIYNFYELDPKSLTFRYCNIGLSREELMIDVNALERDIDLIYDFFEDLNIAISKL